MWNKLLLCGISFSLLHLMKDNFNGKKVCIVTLDNILTAHNVYTEAICVSSCHHSCLVESGVLVHRTQVGAVLFSSSSSCFFTLNMDLGASMVHFKTLVLMLIWLLRTFMVLVFAGGLIFSSISSLDNHTPPCGATSSNCGPNPCVSRFVSSSDEVKFYNNSLSRVGFPSTSQKGLYLLFSGPSFVCLVNLCWHRHMSNVTFLPWIDHSCRNRMKPTITYSLIDVESAIRKRESSTSLPDNIYIVPGFSSGVAYYCYVHIWMAWGK